VSTETRATVPRQPPAGKLTFEEFLDWLDEDTLAEWVDGEVVMTSPAGLEHQDLGWFLTTLMHAVVEHEHLGRVVSAPFMVRLPPPVQRGREPDILFVAREHLDRLKPTYLDGAPDLVVEIVSPESFARDRGEKFVEYEQAGVPEYWLLYPERRRAEFYRLDPEGRYQLVLGSAEGEYQSGVLPRLRFPVEWLWRDPLPGVVEALRFLQLV
jgi:Uma2 family endonuclease